MTPSSACALHVADLVIRAPAGTAVVSKVSFALGRGQSLVVIGETGSGKSLIAQALLGLLPAGFSAEGTIRIGDGLPINAGCADALKSLWAREIAFVPQEPSLALDPTAAVGRQLSQNVSPARSAEALAAVDLPSDIFRFHPFRLSGGMAQRVLFATALASEASLVVADEPTKGLDADRVRIAIDLLKRLLRDGRSLFVVTHDPAVAEAFPQGTVVVLHDGVIVEAGPAAQVLAAPTHRYTKTWVEAHPARWPQLGSRKCRMPAVLEVSDLAFAYRGQRPLFERLTFSVSRGSVTAVVGPSGSGKSTLGDVVLGLKQPSSGRVRWGDTLAHEDRRELRRWRQRYQKLHQDPASTFLPDRPLGRQLEDLKEVCSAQGFDARLSLVLDRLKLRKVLLDRFADEISGGEVQRIAIARLLMLQPALIVADEPTSRLDPIVQREVLTLLREIVDQDGLGLMLISHDDALVRAVADTTVRIKCQNVDS